MAATKAKKSDDLIASNRKARYDYFIDDTVEAGISLVGTEVKALRAGKASIMEAFATVRHGELWLYQAHIPEYEFGNRANHDPVRERKLLVHRSEIVTMERFTRDVGRTLVPMKLYWQRGRAKVLIGMARGKQQHDKRASVAERDAGRAVQRALADRRRG